MKYNFNYSNKDSYTVFEKHCLTLTASFLGVNQTVLINDLIGNSFSSAPIKGFDLEDIQNLNPEFEATDGAYCYQCADCENGCQIVDKVTGYCEECFDADMQSREIFMWFT